MPIGRKAKIVACDIGRIGAEFVQFILLGQSLGGVEIPLLT